jgi:hypothetical protein
VRRPTPSSKGKWLSSNQFGPLGLDRRSIVERLPLRLRPLLPPDFQPRPSRRAVQPAGARLRARVQGHRGCAGLLARRTTNRAPSITTTTTVIVEIKSFRFVRKVCSTVHIKISGSIVPETKPQYAVPNVKAPSKHRPIFPRGQLKLSVPNRASRVFSNPIARVTAHCVC